jgi:hypothetical protein
VFDNLLQLNQALIFDRHTFLGNPIPSILVRHTFLGPDSKRLSREWINFYTELLKFFGPSTNLRTSGRGLSQAFWNSSQQINLELAVEDENLTPEETQIP